MCSNNPGGSLASWEDVTHPTHNFHSFELKHSCRIRSEPSSTVLRVLLKYLGLLASPETPENLRFQPAGNHGDSRVKQTAGWITPWISWHDITIQRKRRQPLELQYSGNSLFLGFKATNFEKTNFYKNRHITRPWTELGRRFWCKKHHILTP